MVEAGSCRASETTRNGLKKEKRQAGEERREELTLLDLQQLKRDSVGERELGGDGRLVEGAGPGD